jgi:hypothetical protein
MRFAFQIGEAVIKEDLCGKLMRRHAALGAFPSVECSDDAGDFIFWLILLYEKLL